MHLAGDNGPGTAGAGLLLSTVGRAAFVEGVSSGEVRPPHDHAQPGRVALGVSRCYSRTPSNLRWLVLKENIETCMKQMILIVHARLRLS